MDVAVMHSEKVRLPTGVGPSHRPSPSVIRGRRDPAQLRDFPSRAAAAAEAEHLDPEEWACRMIRRFISANRSRLS
jgi:hypothetical protein